jgi:HK97 family phage major capsid protein
MSKMSDDMDASETKLNARLEAIDAKADKVEALEKQVEDFKAFEAEVRSRSNTGGGAGGDDESTVKSMRKSIFWKAIRGGLSSDILGFHDSISDDEKEWLGVSSQKAMIVGDDEAGGYLAPEEYVNEIIADTVEFSPIRGLARIRTTSRKAVTIPKKTGSISATWVEETGNRADSGNPTYGMERLQSYEMHGLIKVSRQELEDAAFNVEGFIREELSEQFGSAEGTAFVLGTGTGQPQGILSNASVTSVNSGHATEITADGLIDLYFEPKEIYANNGVFLMARSTLKAIRKLKDGQGQYLWTPGFKTDAKPATIMDRPYVVCPDMPTIAASAYPVAFGDWRRAYYILDRVVMEIITDPYSSKSVGMIEISARKRVGGQVVAPFAIKKLKISA